MGLGLGLVHHLSVTGFLTNRGEANLRWQTSLGISLQTVCDSKWGTRLVTSLQCVDGCKSQASSGLTTKKRNR